MKLLKFPLESKTPFADAAFVYRTAGLHPVPCEDKAPNRIRWRNTHRPPGDKFLSELVTKYGGDNIGILTGRRSGVFIVDVDDPGQVDAMKARFGVTPIATATPSGGVHLWYRGNGEGCGKLPGVDLKGEGGFVVCPPSTRREEKHRGKTYRFTRGGLEDVDKLRPILPGSFPQREGKKAARVDRKDTPRPAGKKPLEEGRNDRLFLAVKEAAPTLDADGLAAFAHRYNATEFEADRLDAGEVNKVVDSVLGYKADDTLMVKGRGPAIVLTKDDLDARIADPPGLALYLKLRVEHETRPEPFAVDRRALAPLLGWSPWRVNAARKRLEDRGDLKLTSKGKATQKPDGTWKTPPNLYALHRGPVPIPNTTIHPFPLLPSLPLGDCSRFQGDFFADDIEAVNVVSLDSWRRGVMPLEVRRATKTKMRCLGLTQNALASRVGLSRPQLTNGLLGRFGFGPEATEKLKAFLEVA